MAAKRSAPDDASCSPAKRAAVSKEGGAWEKQPTLLIRDYGSPSSAVVCGFDLDDTLIMTKSGKKFAVNAADWQWWNPSVPAKLKELAGLGHKLVVFTNQKGLGTGTSPPADFMTKLDAIQASLGLPLLVLAATGSDTFRKPMTGLWQSMVARFNGGVAPDLSKSFYVGDAAGRPALKKVKKDFSDTDFKLALNLGVHFQTPEEHFLGLKDGADGRPQPTSFDFDPRKLGSQSGAQPDGLGPRTDGKPEVIVVVGAPGSGKSSLAISRFPNYVRANQDILKKKEKCAQVCEESLRAGKSVIVDNQNRDAATRKLYVDVAKKLGVPVRAVLVNVPKDMCFHLNFFRDLKPQNDEERAKAHVPSMIIHAYYKNVQPPVKAEGFEEVITITEASFEPRGSPEDIALVKSFLG